MHSPSDAKRILEAALLASQEPLGIHDLKRLFEGELNADTIRKLLAEVAEEWKGRAVELATLAGGWRFQTRAEFQPYLERLFPEKPPRYSRAVMETLAIIAYRQPLTRAEVEQIRGVAVDAVLQTLIDRGLVHQIGRAEVPGRPMTFGTTGLFLEYFGLRDLDGLPAADELRRVVVQKPETLLTVDPGLATAPPEELAGDKTKQSTAAEAPGDTKPSGEQAQTKDQGITNDQ